MPRTFATPSATAPPMALILVALPVAIIVLALGMIIFGGLVLHENTSQSVCLMSERRARRR